MRKKQKHRVPVDVDDFMVAQDRWIKHNGLGLCDFRQFLKCPTYTLFGPRNDIYVTPEAAKKIEMLIGQHWLTILRAWKAQA